jgi:histidinol-phosphatase (PHP family)
MLPPDSHAHSQWSWDAWGGSMEGSCARALELELPAIAFTEHVDFTRWVIAPGVKARMREELAALVAPDGRFDAPALDVDGYLACLRECRERFPGLRILAGVELEAPHWYPEQVKEILDRVDGERLLGALHTVVVGGEPWPVDDLLGEDAPQGMTPELAMRGYLAELLRLVESASPFEVLAHIDYPVRHWPKALRPFDPAAFEEEYRAVLAALAASGRVLEINTRVPLGPEVVRWWHEAGGEALSFGSDSHDPTWVGRRFPEAAAIAEAQGFRPGRHPHDLWRRA